MNKSSQLLAKFTTKNKKFRIDDSIPYSIPSGSNGDSLALLIKSILVEKNKSKDEFGNEIDDEAYKSVLGQVEFDFYINGEFLDSTLDRFLAVNTQIKTETAIEIEYIERNPAPEPIDTIATDDWVCAIRAANENTILLGSYDHTVQLWDKDGTQLANLNGHSNAVKAVAWISTGEEKAKKGHMSFISASHDQTIIIWEYNSSSKRVEKTTKCIGHKESVECIDLNQDKSKFVSGSWDKMLKLWSLIDEDIQDEQVSNKKSKSEILTLTKTPIITLAGHSESISSCKWIDEKTVCTASWDHSIKVWDVFTGQETQTLKSLNKIFLALDYSPLNKLLAAGLSDSYVRLYDPRSKEGNIVKATLSSHNGWCSSVSWSCTNENLLVSGSYDGIAKLWDIRNNKASLYEMVGHEDKILCVDWSVPSLILTGSADNTFKMFNSNQY